MNWIVEKLLTTLVSLLNDIFNFMGEILISTDSQIDYNHILDEVTGLFMYIAGFILVFGLCLNVIHSGVNSDLFTARAAGKICMQFFVGMFFVFLSKTICILVIEQTQIFAVYIFKDVNAINIKDFEAEISEVSNAPFGIGGFVNVMAFILSTAIPMFVICIGVGITAGAVSVKLALRTMSLALLIVFSPPFFACLGSESTREYFKKFINIFLQTVFDLLFMSVIYKVGVRFIITQAQYELVDTDTDKVLTVLMLNPSNIKITLLIIAMCWFMVKPPAVLRNLV